MMGDRKRPSVIYSYAGMVARCYDTEHPDYKFYGERGITVDERWFTQDQFNIDMGTKPSKSYGVRRRDTSLGFTPRNCFWDTGVERPDHEAKMKELMK